MKHRKMTGLPVQSTNRDIAKKFINLNTAFTFIETHLKKSIKCSASYQDSGCIFAMAYHSATAPSTGNFDHTQKQNSDDHTFNKILGYDT